MALGAAQRDVMPLPATAAPSQSRPSTLEFTAVVLASVSDGDGLYPLTENIPPALLPVANRPLLSFQLEMLERAMSFSQVLVLTTERWLPLLSTWVSEQYKGPLEVELLVVPDDAGSADALRHIRAKLTTDFVLLAGDVITDVPFQRMADLHRLQGASATALFREVPPRAAGVAKKEKDLAGIDFVGVDETGQRILSLEAAADCDGVVSISQSLLRAYPHVQLRTDLVDAHVYIFAPWVLDVLEQKPHFSSAKFELLPYLVRKQFLSKANLPPSSHAYAQGGSASGSAKGSGPHASGERASERGEAVEGVGPAVGGLGGGSSGSVSGLSLSAGGEARRRLTAASDFRCCCYVLPHASGLYTLRASSVKEYLQANLDVSRESRVTQYARAEPNDLGQPVKEGNYVHKSCDKDSTIGEAVEVGGRSFIKKACIGPHCRLGSAVKITNCILMDHVVIADKVTMQNVIICGNAEVREGASLKNTQVAAGVTVEAGANHKDEVLTKEDDMEED